MATLTKLCHCGLRNATSAFECATCGADISCIDPSDGDSIVHTEPEQAQTSSHNYQPVLYLNFPHGCVPVTSSFGIGRDPSFSPSADVFASYPNVSKRHAEVKFIGGKFFITDLNSINGTFVDDQRLMAGETVELTNKMILRFSSFLEATIVLQGD